MATNIDLVTTAILDILSENPHERYKFAPFAELVKERIGGVDSRIKITIKVMASMELIKGSFTRSGQLSYVQHNPNRPSDGFAHSAGEADPDAPMVPREKMTEVVKACEERIKKAEQAVREAEKRAKEAVEKAEKEAAERQGTERIVKVVVHNPRTKKKTEHTGIFHSRFEQLTTLIQARENIFLYGPTGSGKTYVCAQAAKICEMDFYFLSCTIGMSPSMIEGNLLPFGKGGQFSYAPSEFVKAYENGGIFLFDEFDAADSNILLLINSALSNDRMAVPKRVDKPYIERHPDFVCIAAANTVGTGSDRMYAGRSKLDTSTLDRFGIGKLYLDYDANVEEVLCPDEVLRNHLLKYRRAIQVNRLERAMSTRFMEKAHKMMHEFGFTLGQIDEAFFHGWREDEMNKVKSFRG